MNFSFKRSLFMPQLHQILKNPNNLRANYDITTLQLLKGHDQYCRSNYNLKFYENRRLAVFPRQWKN